MRKLIILAISLVALAAADRHPVRQRRHHRRQRRRHRLQGRDHGPVPRHEREGIPEDRHGRGESLTGSNVFTATTTTGAGCSDGTIQNHFRNTNITSPITLTEIYNGSADKVTGWNMVPRARASSPSPTRTARRFPNYATICAGHGSISAFIAVFTQTHSDVTTVHLQRHARQHRGHPVRGPRPSDPTPHQSNQPAPQQRPPAYAAGGASRFDPLPARPFLEPAVLPIRPFELGDRGLVRCPRTRAGRWAPARRRLPRCYGFASRLAASSSAIP